MAPGEKTMEETMEGLSVRVRGISKEYRLYGNPYNRLLERMPWHKKPRPQTILAPHAGTLDI